jgi:hypothetical protein
MIGDSGIIAVLIAVADSKKREGISL